MERLSTNRRNVIAALATAPFAACAIPSPARSDDRAEWSALIEDERRLYAAFSAAIDAHSVSEERYYAMRPQVPAGSSRAPHKVADALAQEASGYNTTKTGEVAASDAHDAALVRIWAFRTSDPAIIEEKLRLAIREYDNMNDHMSQIADAITKGGAA